MPSDTWNVYRFSKRVFKRKYNTKCKVLAIQLQAVQSITPLPCHQYEMTHFCVFSFKTQCGHLRLLLEYNRFTWFINFDTAPFSLLVDYCKILCTNAELWPKYAFTRGVHIIREKNEDTHHLDHNLFNNAGQKVPF